MWPCAAREGAPHTALLGDIYEQGLLITGAGREMGTGIARVRGLTGKDFFCLKGKHAYLQ
jgi:hypothetical protein